MGRIMSKALLVLLGLAAIGAGVLHLRQEALETRYRTAQLHRDIQKAQAQLWRQQVEIAQYTSPQVMQTLAGETAIDTAEVDATRE